ncbi:MAG: hypothetical protein AB1352_05470 [Patescibacteria group bacterium]
MQNDRDYFDIHTDTNSEVRLNTIPAQDQAGAATSFSAKDRMSGDCRLQHWWQDLFLSKSTKPLLWPY